MRQAIRDLYFGKTRSAKLFRYGLLLFDIATILFFIVSSLMSDSSLIYAIDVAIAIEIGAHDKIRTFPCPIIDRRSECPNALI